MSARKEKKRLQKEMTEKNMEFWNKIKTFKIGPDFYDIVIRKKVQNGKCCGEMDYDERTINIDQKSVNMDTLHPISTLFHELAHGVVGTFTDCDKDEDDEKLEYWIDFAAESLVMLLLDNTENFRAILDRIEQRKNQKTCQKI